MNQKGFTLVELALVMLIISAIVGGIVVGSNLIRNSEIQSVGGEAQSHLNAIKAFQDKFHALPGDFAQASTVLNGAPNGNGNGFITDNERFYVWQHLALAKMIEGHYTGASVAGIGGAVGQNLPKSQVTGAGWGITYIDPTKIASFDVNYVTVPMGHALWLGGNSIDTSGSDTRVPVLNPGEAELLDRKLDDGYAATGRILSQGSVLGYDTCSDDLVDHNHYKILNNTNKLCALIFMTDF
jgi:prepilin-type N-terminal cleavage/methylation domain-containing protein